jgi:hypothetical protein
MLCLHDSIRHSSGRSYSGISFWSWKSMPAPCAPVRHHDGLHRRSNNLLRVRDCLGIRFGTHHGCKGRLRACKPGEDIHQLSHLGWRIKIYDQEDLAPGGVPVEGLRG